MQSLCTYLRLVGDAHATRGEVADMLDECRETMKKNEALLKKARCHGRRSEWSQASKVRVSVCPRKVVVLI